MAQVKIYIKCNKTVFSFFLIFEMLELEFQINISAAAVV